MRWVFSLQSTREMPFAWCGEVSAEAKFASWLLNLSADGKDVRRDDYFLAASPCQESAIRRLFQDEDVNASCQARFARKLGLA
jgi:hypothetical protein